MNGLSGSSYAFCFHCGCYHIGTCPKIKAIEYYPNGTVKRVEYFDASTPVIPNPTDPWISTTVWPQTTWGSSCSTLAH